MTVTDVRAERGVMSPAATEQHLSALADARLIAVDTETTGFGVRDGRDYLMGVSVAYHVGSLGLFSAYFPFRHEGENLAPEYMQRLFQVLQDKPLIFHNLKFDLHSFATCGWQPSGRLFDTLNIAHMVNEEWPSKELDWLSKTLLKDQKAKDDIEGWAKAFGWHTIPAGLMAPYARHDAELTYRLFEVLWPRMKEQDLAELWPIEADYCRLLTQIERNGIKIDRDFCLRKVERGTDRMGAIEKELGWRPSSPIDLSKFLLDELGYPVIKRTPKGKPCFDKGAMEEYDLLLEADGRKEARQVLEFRGWQKACSSLYDSMLRLVSSDGRIRPNFQQHGTKTGRNSCKDPNLQQIPRESKHVWNGDAKEAFIAEDGYRLIEFDYSQLEFRLATAYGRDQILLDTFARGEDVFIPIAVDVFGGAEHRQLAKTLTYSTLYGAGIARIASALQLSDSEASATRSRYRESYPGIYEKSELAKRNVETKGVVRYWTGRRRHLAREASHKAFNSVIQGGAAELVKRSMLRVSEEVCGESCRMVLTVHDSIVLEVASDRVSSVIPEVVRLMTDWPEFGVTLAVDAHEWGTK